MQLLLQYPGGGGGGLIGGGSAGGGLLKWIGTLGLGDGGRGLGTLLDTIFNL